MNEINAELQIEVESLELQKLLKNLDFIETKKIKNRNYFFLKNSVPTQTDLFI